MPHFLESSKYQTPTGYNDGAFQYGHRTHLGFWEYLKEEPERMTIFNSGMRSLATIGGATRSAGSYPFDEELSKYDLGDDDVAVVDVGGGRGQALEAIRQAFPGLKGRMVLQDVREVIEDARAKGLPSFIEPMVSSFFEPQPVKGKRETLGDFSSTNWQPLDHLLYPLVFGCPLSLPDIVVNVYLVLVLLCH